MVGNCVTLTLYKLQHIVEQMTGRKKQVCEIASQMPEKNGGVIQEATWGQLIKIT
jgi:hypothetical protein